MVVMEERRKLVMDGRGGDEAPRKHQARRGAARVSYKGSVWGRD